MGLSQYMSVLDAVIGDREWGTRDRPAGGHKGQLKLISDQISSNENCCILKRRRTQKC